LGLNGLLHGHKKGEKIFIIYIPIPSICLLSQPETWVDFSTNHFVKVFFVVTLYSFSCVIIRFIITIENNTGFF